MKPEDVTQRLREAGVRATAPRVAILSLLMDDKTHPAAEDVYRRVKENMPSVSLSTVYETVERLVEAGLCQRVEGPGQPARLDGNASMHCHARCLKCGRIIDLPEEVFPPPVVPQHPVYGFSLNSVQVMFEGFCDNCRPQ